MSRLVLLVAFASALLVGAPAVPAGASDVVGDVQLTCFPHAPGERVYQNTFGAARSGGRRHTGTDILSPKRTEVLAVADGTVTALDTASGAGYYVRLVHQGGWETWYMHLDNDTAGTDDGRGGPATAYAEGLAVGDFVRAGDVIGYVGDSGNAEGTSPHTHFELHVGGGPVNAYAHLLDVEERIDAMYGIVTGLILTPAQLTEDVGDPAAGWELLASTPGIECLADDFKHQVQHVLGELPGEGVLLAGVEAR